MKKLFFLACLTIFTTTSFAKEITISAGSKIKLTPNEETTVICGEAFDLKKVKNICSCMFESVPGTHFDPTKEYVSYLYHPTLVMRLKNKIVERGANFDECNKAAYMEFAKLCIVNK